MSEYVPLYQELYLPVRRPEKEDKPREEKTFSRVVIDLVGDSDEEKIPSYKE